MKNKEYENVIVQLCLMQWYYGEEVEHQTLSYKVIVSYGWLVAGNNTKKNHLCKKSHWQAYRINKKNSNMNVCVCVCVY